MNLFWTIVLAVIVAMLIMWVIGIILMFLFGSIFAGIIGNATKGLDLSGFKQALEDTAAKARNAAGNVSNTFTPTPFPRRV